MLIYIHGQINGLIESQRVINANVVYPHALVESGVVDVDPWSMLFNL